MAIARFGCCWLFAFSLLPGQPVDVLTRSYGVERTGANVRETQLNVKDVSSSRFGKLFERAVQGDIYAQPLIKTGVAIPGLGQRDLVFVATVANHLYAFDASSPEFNKPYWHVDATVFGEAAPKAKVTDLPAGQEYLNFESTIGIVATPVIDEQTNTLYVVANSFAGGEFRFRIHAFDLATGREKTEIGSPARVAATYNGNGIGSEDGKLRFEARRMLNRAALLLVEGYLYLAFASHLDGEPSLNAHGWVMAYAAANLKQVSALCTTPDGILGGIWQSGAGLSAERRERTFPLLYGVTGNGSVGGRNYGQSVLQLYPGAMLSVKLAFTPEDHAYQNDRDLDLSTGFALMPDHPLGVACSKEGKCYVVNTATLRLVQEMQVGVNSYGGDRAPNIHGTPVVWRNGAGRLRMYVWAEEDALRAFEFDGQRFNAAGKSSMRAPENSMPGGMLTLSANGINSGIVWANMPLRGDANAGTVEGVVRAFDATKVETELWNSERSGERDRLGKFAKFCPPVVANGKLYVATFGNKLVVYGMRQPAQDQWAALPR